jgi:integrase
MGVRVKERKGAWWIYVCHNGKRKAKRIGEGDPGKKAAKTAAVKIQAMLALGDLSILEKPEKAAPVPTFKEAIERWKLVDGATLKAATREDYQSTLNRHILSTFDESRPITSITRAQIEDWWGGIRAKGLSNPRLTTIRGVFTQILARAVASGSLPSNPADVIRGRLGKCDKAVRQAEWLTEPELNRLLDVAKEREPNFYPLLLTIASAGLRMGEIMALQVGDVDLDRCKFYLRRRLRKGEESSPKSGKPRTLPVPPFTMAVLRAWIDVVRAEAAVRGAEARWLFPNRAGNPVDEPHIRTALKRLLPLAGIHRRITPHTLRHTYASLAIQRGVPLLTVSRQLGHASITTTANTYTHLAPDAAQEAADAWESILNAPKRNPGATSAPESTQFPVLTSTDVK